MLRDHERARHAYGCVKSVTSKKDREEYEVAVNGLGPHVLRSGLAATMAFLERQKDRPAVRLLMDHLANARIPGLENTTGRDLPERIRGLGLDDYMLVTREFLKVTLWFKRAVQAVLK